eukprot:4224413-Amphidinium_carterae.1
MEQSKPQLNCEDCTMSNWVRWLRQPIRTSNLHRPPAWGHNRAHMPFKTNWHCRGARRQRRPFSQQ